MDPFYLVLDWGMVFKKFQVSSSSSVPSRPTPAPPSLTTNPPRSRALLAPRKVWRLVTCFFIIGGFSWNFLMRVILIHNYGVGLRKGVFQFKTPEFLYMLFGALTLLSISLALPGFNLIVLNGSFVFMLLYVWSKHYPTQSVSIMGLFQVQGFYLPWAFLMINMVLGGSLWQDLFGILTGHFHYFLTELNPNTRQAMEPPEFVHKFLAWTKTCHVSPAYAQRAGGWSLQGAGAKTRRELMTSGNRE